MVNSPVCTYLNVYKSKVEKYILYVTNRTCSENQSHISIALTVSLDCTTLSQTNKSIKNSVKVCDVNLSYFLYTIIASLHTIEDIADIIRDALTATTLYISRFSQSRNASRNNIFRFRRGSSQSTLY